MSEEEHRWFDIRAKFKLIAWEEIEEGQKFWYFEKRLKRNDQHAAGAFTMVDKEKCIIKNPQGVQFIFLRLKDNLQPMILVATDNDL